MDVLGSAGGATDPKLIAKAADNFTREAITNMLAGTFTTGYTFGTAAQLLSQHPEWLDRMAEEQDRLKAEHGDSLDRHVRTIPSRCCCSILTSAVMLTYCPG
jgi:cytochrome P450